MGKTVLERQIELSLLDVAFQKLTGQKFENRGVINCREAAWQRFVSAKFGLKELEAVILHIKRGIAEGYRNPGALGFMRLIGNLDVFEHEWAIARNAPKPATDKEKVLRSTGRKTASEFPPTIKATREYVDKLIDEMRKAAK